MSTYVKCFDVWLEDASIAKELRLLLTLYKLSLKDGYCFAKNETLAEYLGEKPETISRKIKVLIDKKYIKVDYEKRGFEIISRKIYVLAIDHLINRPLTIQSTDHCANSQPTIAQKRKYNKIYNNKININNKEIKDENKFSLSFSPEFKKYLIELENYPLCKKIEIQLTDKNLTEILKDFEFEQIIEALGIIENSRNVKSRKNLNLTMRKILKNNFGGGKEFQRDLKAFKQVYIDWYYKNNNKPPKLTKSDNMAAIELFKYLKESSKAQNSFGAIENFKYIFENIKKVEPFYQNQIKFHQINNNITILINQIKNGYATKQSNSKQSIQDYARTSINSQTRDYSEPAF